MNYAKLTVADLKDLLKQRGLSATGLYRKQQIIDVLEEDDAESGEPAEEDDADADADAEEEVEVKVKTSSRSSTKRKASSPVPAGPTSKQPKKAKPEPPAAAAVDTPTDTVKSAPKITEAQFAPAGAKLDIPIDEGVSSSWHVYVDPDTGIIYDASLNQTNASNNNNKFYRVQLLENASSTTYQTWTRWGRVGEHGQTAMLGDGSLEDAFTQFEKKFKDKSGLKWDDRGEKPKPKKYVFVERSYLADDDEAPAQSGASPDGDEPAYTPPKCTLEPPVQSLMKLIFNPKHFANTMQALNYDANKLPLGKLSKATITKGFEILKELSALMSNTSSTASLGNFEELSNQYYSYIPHSFGRNRPPIIRTLEMLKPEIELLDSLSDLKNADEILKKAKETASQIHPLDSRFRGLGMQEMQALSPSSSEFSEINQYLHKTCGSTHHVKYEVQDIFRIQREGEFERFDKNEYTVGSDRRLLWHGSRSTNFGGILSQGLRIAPPEAPVNGYMFGKGIYLADMSSKSAGYCCPYQSDGHALLLLCEAELGKPMQTLTGASYQAAETAKEMGALSTWGQGRMAPKAWKDAGCIHPSLTGTTMPDTTEDPGDTNVASASLYYNEYICYDIAQVRLRYLLRVKM